MRNVYKLAFVLVVLFCVSGYAQDDKSSVQESAKPAANQTQAERPVYRIEFTVSEVDGGKRLNTRSYTLMARDGDRAQANMGTRVPVPTSSFQPGTGAVSINPSVNTQYQYMDVGLIFNLRPRQSGDHVVLDGQFEMSSFAPDEKLPTPASQPVVRKVRAEFQAAVQPGKQTTVALLDDVTSKKQYQLEATVTKIK